jgi:hypothetical protein
MPVLKPKFMNKEFKYPVEVLLAFGEALKGNKEIYNWLLNNGYKELAALSNSIRGSNTAFDWLMKHYPQLAAFDQLLDKETAALPWLQKHGFRFYIIFAQACHMRPQALAYLKREKLNVYIRLAGIISQCLKNKEHDIHKKRFW